MARDANAIMLDWETHDEIEATDGDWPWRKANRRGGEQRRPPAPIRRERGPRPPRRGPTRAAREGREEFRCRHCRALIGPTVGGGRHRNHCPLCLHSRHVDDRRPGDRASACRALMAPVGRFDRPDGEPTIVHRCLGCGQERHNRVAADDTLPTLMRLPLIPPHATERAKETA